MCFNGKIRDLHSWNVIVISRELHTRLKGKAVFQPLQHFDSTSQSHADNSYKFYKVSAFRGSQAFDDGSKYEDTEAITVDAVQLWGKIQNRPVCISMSRFKPHHIIII